MLPFDKYPHAGRELLGLRSGDTCRRGYGLHLQRLTGLASCAYCGVSLIGTFEQWLMMAVDHVVPRRAGEGAGIPVEWLEDYSNLVLCCIPCNSFLNRWGFDPQTLDERVDSLDAFCALRDRVFQERKAKILARREQEREYYEQRQWEAAPSSPEAERRLTNAQDQS